MLRKQMSEFQCLVVLADEQPSEDETKYTQQGAKPKKKRRAPAPPIPFPGKSTSDRQVNSNVSESSMPTAAS